MNRIFLNLFLNSQISLSLNSKCKVSPFKDIFFLLIGCYYIYGWITFASFIWAFIVKWWFCITNFFFCISSPPMFRLNSTISVLSLQIQQMYKHRYIYREIQNCLLVEIKYDMIPAYIFPCAYAINFTLRHLDRLNS